MFASSSTEVITKHFWARNNFEGLRIYSEHCRLGVRFHA